MEWLLVSNCFYLIQSGQFQGEHLWGLVFMAGPVVKTVLILLFLFSVVSWAIIFNKIILFRKVGKESREFWRLFLRNEKMSTILAKSKRIKKSPLTQMFKAGYQELNKIGEDKMNPGEGKYPSSMDYQQNSRIMNNVNRALKMASNLEIIKLEKGLIFLAITGSAAPFVGLFGTVWGIMNSFRTIGIRGSANLATVAPGIAEALIATAFGLAAAIPAVVFYNYLAKKMEIFSSEMDNFSSDYLNLIEGGFFTKNE